MVVTIHQPEHLPWLGFFDKVHRANCFVILDHVQYRKNYFQNRNRIRAANGPLWITVPVRFKGRGSEQINEVQIDNRSNPRWRQKCWSSLAQSYRKASFWSDHSPYFEALYGQKWEHLALLNESVIHYLLRVLGINVDVVKSSSLLLAKKGSDLILEICRSVSATVYLSGVSGREYLDLGAFRENGIEVVFQEFHHPIYRQLYDPFIPCMSVVDLLFNHGSRSMDIIKGVGVATMDDVFT